MTATSHALIGVAIAAMMPNPLIAIPVAIGSHVICDLVPHWDAGTHFPKKGIQQLFIESVLDVGLSGILSSFLLLFIFPEVNILYGFIIVFAAQSLDWFSIPMLFGLRFPPFTWVYKISKATNTKLDKPWGIVTQVAVVCTLLILAKAI